MKVVPHCAQLKLRDASESGDAEAMDDWPPPEPLRQVPSSAAAIQAAITPGDEGNGGRIVGPVLIALERELLLARLPAFSGLAKGGTKSIAIVTPGFAADCLETLEEIAIECAHTFKRFGGENFATIPCLNDSAPGMLVLWQLALRELKGWV